MQLLHLYYFKLLAESEHLLQTAKMVHISPPALSTTISKLGAELNVTLFDHVGRNIRLNENGRKLYAHVCTIFAELDAIKNDFSMEASQQDVINIAVSAPSLWNEVIGAFIKINPNVTVRHATLREDQLQNPEALSAYNLILTDIGEISDKSWEHAFIIEDPPVLLVYPEHQFADREYIFMAEVQNEPFVALTKGYSSRSYFENACKQAGFVPKVVAEVDYVLRAQLVENRYGIAFSSVLGARAVKQADLRMILVKYPPNPRMQTVFWKTSIPLSPTVTQFRDFLVRYYRKQ